MEVFAATLPIFDRLGNVYGYDLVLRDGLDGFRDGQGGDMGYAGAEIAANFDELAGHGRACVVFPAELLLSGLPHALPPEKLSVGIRTGAADGNGLLAACRDLKAAGYQLAGEDFRAAQLAGPLAELLDIARIDVSAVPADEQQILRRELDARGVRRLARNVHTHERHNIARDGEYWYFQGEFFRTPILAAGRDLPTSKLRYLELLRQIHRPELSYDEVEAVIKGDVAMTYRLLRFINSVWYGLKYEVTSIRHALVLLGPGEVRLWASLLVLRELGDNKPAELFRRSLTLAKAGELLAPLVGLAAHAPELFLMGTFTYAEALTDAPLARVLDGLPLGRSVKQALLERRGPYADVCEALLAGDRGLWGPLSAACQRLRLAEQRVPDLFRKSRAWADKAMALL